MRNFSAAMKMAQGHTNKENMSICEAYDIVDNLVKASWHVWITAENYRETLQEAKEIAQEMEKVGIANYDGNLFTIDLWEKEVGYGYSVYPLNSKPDEDGDFDEDSLIDGGEIECATLVCALEYIDKIVDVREIA